MLDPEKQLNAQQLKVVNHRGVTEQVFSRENRNKLHQAAMAAHTRIGRETGNPYLGFKCEYFDEDTRCTAWISQSQGDGTNLIHVIRVYLFPNGDITVDETTEIDSNDTFWQEKLAWLEPSHQYHSLVVRAGNHHFFIGEATNEPKSWKGYGGREWRVEFFDGRIVETDNLWSQGTIPPSWRERLPNNAKLIDVTGERFKQIREDWLTSKKLKDK